MSLKGRRPSGRQTIVRAAIHPGIGIARVGNSVDAYFIGPEVADPEPGAPGFYHDETGALKRQAARFRIYGYDASGNAVAELTSTNAAIRWTVHVANTKAAWYEFQLALDVPEATSAPTPTRRNASVEDRRALVIDPGPRSIAGRRRAGRRHAFDSGTFLGRRVYLGELRTDESGRLIVLGGRGVSASHTGAAAQDFANNDGWHDDVSDGPVTAEVTVAGRKIPVEPAWVVVAPPNYAPNLVGIRTMYDLLYDRFVEAGWFAVPERVSFTRDILPLFRRLVDLQWVNHGFAAQFGRGKPYDFADEDLLAALSSPDDRYRGLRTQVANFFRRFDRDGSSPAPWPWLYGDAMNLPPAKTPRQHTSVSYLQLLMLSRWAKGVFEADYDPAYQPPRRLGDLPVAQQPAMLDRASLTHCLADAFHPGCEMTWIMRHTSLFEAPFRLRHARRGALDRDYGPQLLPDATWSMDGPLYAQGPGGITRWMAVPWQTDSASCRSGYEPLYDPYLPTFWPARVPNHVLTLEAYRVLMDGRRPREERLNAFNARASWYRRLGSGGYIDQVNRMVSVFGSMGVVETRPGIADDPDVPSVVQVETATRARTRHPAGQGLVVHHVAEEAADAHAAERKRIARDAGVPEQHVTVGAVNKVRRLRGPVE